MRILYLPPNAHGQITGYVEGKQATHSATGANMCDVLGQLLRRDPELFGITAITHDVDQITRDLTLDVMEREEVLRPENLWPRVISRGTQYGVDEMRVRRAILELVNLGRLEITADRMVKYRSTVLT
jgi:hypothetical protein